MKTSSSLPAIRNLSLPFKAVSSQQFRHDNTVMLEFNILHEPQDGRVEYGGFQPRVLNTMEPLDVIDLNGNGNADGQASYRGTGRSSADLTSFTYTEPVLCKPLAQLRSEGNGVLVGDDVLKVLISDYKRDFTGSGTRGQIPSNVRSLATLQSRFPGCKIALDCDAKKVLVYRPAVP